MNSEAAEAGRGKSGLIKAAMEKMAQNGLPISRRKAAKAVNAVFDLMKRALRRGEVVELPVGKVSILSTPAKRKGRRIQKFRNIQDKAVAYRPVQLPKKMIRFRPDKKLIERAPFSPPPPRPLSAATVRKAEEVEQLFHDFTGRDVDIVEFKSLMEAADRNLDWLLARLRQLKKEEYTFKDDPYKLVATVRQRYWVRPLPESRPKPAKKSAVKTTQSQPQKKVKQGKLQKSLPPVPVQPKSPQPPAIRKPADGAPAPGPRRPATATPTITPPLPLPTAETHTVPVPPSPFEPAVEPPLHLPPAPPAPSPQEVEIRQRVRQLMDSKDDLTPAQFDLLVDTTNGNLDVLLGRLEVLCQQAQEHKWGFQKVSRLCEEIRGLARGRYR